MAAVKMSRGCPLVLVLFNVIVHAFAQYHGKQIGTFGPSTQHQVAGTVYAVDSNTIRIIGFTYDGTAPDAFIWGGESGTIPTSAGYIIPVMGSTNRLGQYSNVDLELDLPAGKTVASLTWISVWCRAFTANFGHVTIPSNFEAPSEYNLGQLGFSPRVHNVYASAVRVLNDKQIRFENLDYDGYGPAAYFWVGPGGTPNNQNGYAIPDENGGTGVIRRYNGETITITLQDGVTIHSFGHIGLWCVRATQDFGHLDVPANLNVPPFGSLNPPAPTGAASTPSPATTPSSDTMDFPNCEVLVDGELQVRWKINGSDLVVQLSNKAEAGNYAAFGVSGSPTSTSMIGGDVVVAYMNVNTNQPQVVDYYLSARSQCAPQNGQGACPDVDTSNQANNDVTLIGAVDENGVSTITYRRPLAAQDATYDKEIATDRSIYVIWARGRINDDGRVAIHSQWSRRESNFQINFGRASSSCPPLVGAGTDSPPMNDAWVIPPIVALENTTFVAQMGLSGGRKGYDAITGRPGWGIAFFIDDLLIPEITVRRGQTYTFMVSAGNDSAVSANYHPLYITDDPNGGYAQLSAAEQMNVNIYAGPVEGPLCQWMNTPSTGSADDFTTFQEYRETLTVTCLPGDPGRLVWTVADDTPDLVYYHCYTHRFLGWKIHVVDEDYVEPTTPTTSNPSAVSTTSSATTNQPATSTMEPIVFPNCEELIAGDFSVRWKINESDIIVQLNSTIIAGEYMAFGVSGSTTSTSMMGGDVTVAFLDSSNRPQVRDFHLSSRSVCFQDGTGACPDTLNQGTDDVILLGSVTENGRTSITYRRPLNTPDAAYDKEIPTDRSIYVIWALGEINDDGSIEYHSQRADPDDNLQINFGRQTPSCFGITPTTQATTTPDGATTLSVSIFTLVSLCLMSILT